MDADGAGQRDMWRSYPDMFASAANYLARSGWRRGWNWGREVILPDGFNIEQAGLGVRKPIADWRRLGVRRIADSGRLSANTRGRPNCSRPALGTVAVLRAQSSLQASRPSRPNSKRVASRCAGALWCRGDCLQGSLGDREPPPYAEPRRCPVDGSILRGRSCPGALASSRGTRSG